MIPVWEAKKIVAEETPAGSVRSFPLAEVFRRVLAESIVSPIDSPLFNSSAMDGFALRHGEARTKLKIAGVISAGDSRSWILKEGETIRIMTGAPIPEGATAVIPQEEVEECDGAVLIRREVEAGENIRRRGEEIKKGELVLNKGALLTPSVVGFLASLGIFKVPIYAPPKIFLIPTGSELMGDDSNPKPPERGKIFDSASHALRAALQELQIQPVLSHGVPDIPKLLSEVIERALETGDVVLITGGVSVGSSDFVKPILKELGVETLFWGVAQKPGKPLYFGKKNKKLVFGLPGNPVSSLVSYYEYVRPALLKWMGHAELFLPEVQARLLQALSFKGDRAHFLRARGIWKDHRWIAEVLPGQESHRLKGLAMANALLFVPEGISFLEAGSEVTLHWLP